MFHMQYEQWLATHSVLTCIFTHEQYLPEAISIFKSAMLITVSFILVIRNFELKLVKIRVINACDVVGLQF